MLIVCPTCGTTYNVGASNLGEAGRQVRCVRCSAVWLAGKPQPIASAAAKAKPSAIFDPEMALAAARNQTEAGGVEGAPASSPRGERQPDEQAPDAAVEGNWPGHSGESSVDDRATGTPETIEAPPLAPAEGDGERPRLARTPERDAGEDIESFAARRARNQARRRRSRWPLGRMQTVLVALLVIDGALILWRSNVVRAFPQTASLYATIGLPVNLRGLTFENVKTTRETHEGVTVLAVEGGIVNATSKAIEVPRLHFAVRNAAGHEIYSWTAMPARTVLSAREAVSFRSRLASPPPDANDVIVRFFGRRDADSGGR